LVLSVTYTCGRNHITCFWRFLCGKFNYLNRHKAIWVTYFFLSELSRVCVLWGICPFHLKSCICWHKDVHYISFFNSCISAVMKLPHSWYCYNLYNLFFLDQSRGRFLYWLSQKTFVFFDFSLLFYFLFHGFSLWSSVFPLFCLFCVAFVLLILVS